MAEPDWNPDTGGRSLAEILREAGIESANRAARRRSWDDPEETGIRQRRAEAAAADGMAGRYGRRRSDQGGDPPVAERRQSERRAPAVDRRAAVPERREAGERRDLPERRQPRRPADPSTAAIPGLRPDRKPGVPSGATSTGMASGPVPSLPRQSSGRVASRPIESHPSTGPIPVVRPEHIEDLDDDDATPQESALAWLRFAGELVIALAAGVGVYFAATVLWDTVPHLAVLLAPLAVTGLVAGVGVWRQRQGREPVGLRLLAVLVFAGTLLTIAPAAGLLAAS
ncbi:DUF2157 domain-containing protein [Blastococcus sp. PRF04-17]|uniref:DUF2157 domain-containing protein n=1 Tax=Blastococcus sp. PRF04-17 TaxID=2933797 RepID=UPI001FF54A8E|nr:DUF2157 domain-containing protein [Blastococcus sp. PRF04-17]UOY00957.1 DUF2157 domain-containing protein [Blastococcus sp. PRF04-17]